MDVGGLEVRRHQMSFRLERLLLLPREERMGRLARKVPGPTTSQRRAKTLVVIQTRRRQPISDVPHRPRTPADAFVLVRRLFLDVVDPQALSVVEVVVIVLIVVVHVLLSVLVVAAAAAAAAGDEGEDVGCGAERGRGDCVADRRAGVWMERARSERVRERWCEQRRESGMCMRAA